MVALRDSDEEHRYMLGCLSSVFALGPSELILALDVPSSKRIVRRAKELAKRHGFHGLRIIAVPMSSEWNMQFAKVVYETYSQASSDHILCFDIDTVLADSVLLGLEDIGRGQVACISFTKNLLRRNFSDAIRNFFYRRHVKRAKMAFAGLYWIYRPYYYELVKEREFKKIYNGIDTFLVQKILSQEKYRLVTRKEAGCNCLTYQSNDYPWRQFQDGYLYSGHGMQAYRALLHTFVSQHPYFWKGYRYNRKNRPSEMDHRASTMSLDEWTLDGSLNVPKMDWNYKGTGFVKDPRARLQAQAA
jgi:hypothetical protein